MKRTHRFIAQFDPIVHFLHQARLADARLAHQLRPHHAAVFVRVEIRRAQSFHLGIAPDGARLNPGDAARDDAKGARFGAAHEKGCERFAFAFDRERRLGRHIKHAAHVAIGVVRNENSARRCRALQARGEIHCIARRGKFFVRVRAKFPDDDETRVNTDAKRDDRRQTVDGGRY